MKADGQTILINPHWPFGWKLAIRAMDDCDRFKLLYGPYVPPKCAVGDKLPCEYRGREVTVRGMSDAPIQWPSTRGRGNHSPILCGELIRAVKVEAELAVAYHWGVRYQVVWRWRRALGVSAMTPGSRRLRIEYAEVTLTPEVRAKGKEAMHSARVRAKLSAIRKGRRQHPNTLAALLEAAGRPKSEDWKRKFGERSRKMWEHPELHGLPVAHTWTDEENELLGTASDRVIAERIGVSRYAVAEQRRRLGISRRPEPWTPDQIAVLGTASDREVGRRIGRSESAVHRKRESLGIPSTLVRWTDAEIAQLGTASDPEVARKLGRHPASVQSKREKLGIAPFTPRWTAEELSWLGTDSDKAVARALGRTLEAVKLRRQKLGIRAWRGE